MSVLMRVNRNRRCDGVSPTLWERSEIVPRADCFQSLRDTYFLLPPHVLHQLQTSDRSKSRRIPGTERPLSRIRGTWDT